MASSGGVARPGRQMAAIFAEMARACPKQIAAYGQCASGDLPASMDRGNCDTEFKAMQQCFQKCRGKMRKR